MAGTVSLELDPIFLKGLGYLHSKSKDSAEKLKALLDESLARGSDSIYRTSLKEAEVSKVSLPKMTKQDSKSSSSSSSSSSITSSSSKSSSSDKTKKESEKRTLEKIRVDPGEGPEPPKKPRVEKQDSHSSPIAFQTKDIPIPDFTDIDETNADDFAMEMGLACVVCRQMTVTSGNQLVECQECHNLYHQECHKPQVTDKDVNDPRLVWYCARCTRQMKRMAQKTQKPPQKPAPALATAAPMLKDPLVKKTEIKPKTETTGSFQAFKRTEVKASVASGNTSSSSSSLPPGLTGWAAFTKTSNVGPSSTKLSTSQPGSSKSTPPPSGSKPVGLSALANVKPGLATKPSGGSSGGSGNGNNGSSTVPMKPPPPLTLGKQVLSRSASGDSLGKMTVTGSQSPGAAPSSSLGGNGGSGGNGGGNGGNSAGSSNSSSSSSNNNNNSNNGAKASADGKTPTSQESQLNAMKRLQMVKKKAAQKKLKK
ncbi:integrator complex subunit 12 isoform X2 [Labeo rohita]|uniref:integrator complex subunit 12 isoform X2 n=1 Tax=Labeo rohita TaxID=84645 RepID=UPI0021E33116|nr:integrator complex subunit 12 isoform X2 [Labeo rohita]